MLDAARLSGDPQKLSGGKRGAEVSSSIAGGAIQCLQRGQGSSLTLPLSRYQNNTVTSAAIVHHQHQLPITNQQQFMHSTTTRNHQFDAMTPTADAPSGRMSLSTFAPGNANFPTPNNHQVLLLYIGKR